MASSAENPYSFTGPTSPWSNVSPTLRRGISGRMSIVRFGDGASAFCWLAQRWLAPTDYQFTLSLVSPWLFLLPFLFFLFLYFFMSLLSIFKLFLDFFLLSFFLFKFSFSSFLLCLSFFYFFLSSWALSHLSMRVLVMCIDSKFVFEFIAWVMVIMLVDSTCQKWIHVRTWPALRFVHESTTFKGMRVRVSIVLHLKPFLFQVNWLLRFLTVRPWDPLSSLEPLPVLIKVPKQEGLVVY